MKGKNIYDEIMESLDEISDKVSSIQRDDILNNSIEPEKEDSTDNNISDNVDDTDDSTIDDNMDDDNDIDGDINKTKSIDDNEKELLDSLNQIFTPILITQGLESNLSENIQEACSEASVLFEKNIIKFDNSTKFAQLISICALLIASKKNDNKFNLYKKSIKLAKDMKINIQKDYYDQAKDLAKKYLMKVSSTNNSSIARQAANDLLPESQH